MTKTETVEFDYVKEMFIKFQGHIVKYYER